MRKRLYSAKRRRIMKQGDLIRHLEIFERDEWICYICNESVDRFLRGESWMRATLDHIIPLSRHGTHTFDNVATAHWLCNRAKSNKIIGVDITIEEIMMQVFCEVGDCKKPRHQGMNVCGKHISPRPKLTLRPAAATMEI